MADDIAGRGNPQKTLRLLWGKAPVAKRGPKARVLHADLVAKAVEIADADGLSGLTTRRVADEVGISAMSFYTYAPGKNELVDLMVDRALSEVRAPRGETWRERLADVARSNWALLLRHPWLLDALTHRPVIGPGLVAKYDAELAAIDGIGLGDIEMERVLTLVLDYVFGAVRGAARERLVKERTGMNDGEWWSRVEPLLGELVPWSDYPTASRVGAAFGEAHGAHDPDGTFAFGLERLLDGLALFIDRRAAELAKNATASPSS